MYRAAELNAVELSPTKKDFYQIWNELLDVANKLSARWDPTSTNEADPGIVLLKVLTAIADKLNYQIDANTLEAFMPSVAQEASMRKLCEMLGYSMRYFQSATTTARITYTGEALASGTRIFIDQFTNLKDIDGNVNYVTLRAISLSANLRSDTVPCIEGELVTCATDNNNIVSLFNLDDNNRYYLPETQIAANGIFISDAVAQSLLTNTNLEFWQPCDNLNTILLGNKCYKFGFDSSVGLPYLQFPSDIGNLIGDGLIIKYIRSSGASGNIAVNTLSRMEPPLNWSRTTTDDIDTSYQDVTLYAVSNISSATNGANPETIDEAYWNYQKTIGTFDTLVTCRDYMNKIYRMVSSDVTNTPLVSNINVSDIRSDINRTRQICTLTAGGIKYPRVALKDDATDVNRINHFDLVLYPFTTIYNMGSKTEYQRSFKAMRGRELAEFQDIIENSDDGLKAIKTISHNYVYPENTDIACVKVYYQVSARISTNYKVTNQEAEEIEKIVHEALYKAFNMRYMIFGEELPLESILQTMEFADSRIKNINMDDPKLKIVAALADGTEYTLVDPDGFEITAKAQEIYDDLVLSNVLAGKVALLQYDNTFTPSLDESFYPIMSNPFGDSTEEIAYDPYYIPGQTPEKIQTLEFGDRTTFPTLKQEAGTTSTSRPEVEKLVTAYEIDIGTLNADTNNSLTLDSGEVISFRLPNFKTLKTYPGFVNYFVALNPAANAIPAVPATMITLQNFLSEPSTTEDTQKTKLTAKFNSLPPACRTYQTVSTKAEAQSLQARQGWLFTKVSSSPDVFEFVSETGEEIEIPDGTTRDFYYFKLTSSSYFQFYNWLIGNTIPLYLKDKQGDYSPATAPASDYHLALYTLASTNNLVPGKLIDAEGNKYKNIVTIPSAYGFAELSTKLYIPQLWTGNSWALGDGTDFSFTADGLGRDAVLGYIPANTEYQLQENEYIALNYSTSDGQAEGVTVPVNVYIGPKSFIKANFKLVDSITQSSTVNYSKTNDLPQKFQNPDKTASIDLTLPGMYTLGTQEQIEHRSPVKVELNNTSAYVYWILQDSSILDFPFDSEGKYILKSGEYFYYTDSVQQAMAYYGSGTQISYTATGTTRPDFRLNAEDLQITAEQIAEQGLLAAIPWKSVDLSKTPLTIQEFQYINLTAGDTLLSLEPIDSQVTYITESPTRVRSARYIQGGTEQQLPPTNLTAYAWEVQSKLELNIGPTVPLELRSHLTSSGDLLANSRLELYTRNQATGYLELCQAYVPLYHTDTTDDGQITISAPTLSLYANAILLGTSGTFFFTGDENAKLRSQFNLKLSETIAPVNQFGQVINLGNAANGLTLLTVPEISSATTAFANFNAIVRPNTVGMLTFFYQPNQPSTAQSSIAIGVTSYADNLELSGFAKTQLTKVGDLYYLQPGLNTITFNNSCALALYCNAHSGEALGGQTLLMSTLSLVAVDEDGNAKLNPQLGLYQRLNTVLSKIECLANGEFFYNNPIVTTVALDLNALDSTDTLRRARNWLDAQNINNNFTIAEIDSEYLPEHVVVSKYSRSNL